MRPPSCLLIILLSAQLALPFPTSLFAGHEEDAFPGSERGTRNSVGSAGHPAAAEFPRLLQSSGGNSSTDSGGTADPDVICQSLNEQLQGEMTCSCERYGKRAVSVSCNGVVDTCNADNSYCVRLSTQYYTDDKGVPIVMTSCTNLTTPGLTEKADTCVQVFPAEAGNFTTITKCYATLNDQSCDCSVCDAASAAAAAAAASEASRTTATTTNEGASVSINCCRIMDGAQATCLPVISSGPVAVQFDQVSEEKQCKATSGGASTRYYGEPAKVVALLLLAGTQLLFSAGNLW